MCDDHPFNKDARLYFIIIFGSNALLISILFLGNLLINNTPIPTYVEGNIIQATWIYHYQGLLAGFLSFISAGAVILAFFLERHFTKKDKLMEAEHYFSEIEDIFEPFHRDFEIAYIEGLANHDDPKDMFNEIFINFRERPLNSIVYDNNVLIKLSQTQRRGIKKVREAIEAIKKLQNSHYVTWDLPKLERSWGSVFWEEYSSLFNPKSRNTNFFQWKKNIPQRYGFVGPDE